jgi:outer membrane autotransporter protein
VLTRLNSLRRQRQGGIDLTGLRMRMDGLSISGEDLLGALHEIHGEGGAAGADDYAFERWGFFVNGNIDWGNRDASSNEDGFDFQILGITAGADYMVTDGLVLGFALGFGSSDVDIDANGGDLNADAWTTTLYGTYYATENLYLEGSASYGWASYDQTRNIRYSLLGNPRKAKADFDGDQFALMIGGGYDLIRGRHIFDFYGRLRWIEATIDGYREQGANGLDLNIDSQDANSFRSILGAQYQTSISTAKAILVPQVWLEWSHEFEDGDDQVRGHFVNDPGRIPFALATDSLDSDFFRLGLGLGAQFAKGRTAFITYEAAIGMNDYREQSVNAGLRLAF